MAKDEEEGNNVRIYLTLVILGIICGGSSILSITLPLTSRMTLYICVLSVFHGLEFFMTAIHHPDTVNYQCTPL